MILAISMSMPSGASAAGLQEADARLVVLDADRHLAGLAELGHRRARRELGAVLRRPRLRRRCRRSSSSPQAASESAEQQAATASGLGRSVILIGSGLSVWSVLEDLGRGSPWPGRDCGLVKNSSGVRSSTIAPSSMKTTRLAAVRAKPISCVTTTIVMPPAARSTMTSSTSLIISGSSAEVGSSKSMTFGSIASARAIATRCCWPPESWAGYLSAWSATPTRSSSSLGLAPRRRRLAACGP